jgi:hypothetical protein
MVDISKQPVVRLANLVGDLDDEVSRAERLEIKETLLALLGKVETLQGKLEQDNVVY